MIREAIAQARAGRDLDLEQMTRLVEQIMEGHCGEDDIVDLLVALHAKGESVEEVAGAALAMRRKMTRIACPHQRFIDVVGTGGDGSSTFNISTAAAIVTAAAGLPVAKHGNRGFTSKSGSADVLRALGVQIEADLLTVEACLAELGICFCFAPLMHTAMRHVGPARKRIATPTIFNILGPLANPAGAPYQLLGVGRAHQQRLLADALALLGAVRVCVVHGEDGLDEVTLSGATEVIETTPEGTRPLRWTAADFHLPSRSREAMIVDGPEQSARIIRDVLEGREGPCRDIVVANAAAALWTVNGSGELGLYARRAEQAIDSGAARELLERLARKSQG